MAAGPVTMAVVDNILKEVYEDKLRDQLQSDVLTLRRVEKTSEGVSEDVGGKYVRFPIRTSRNHGMGARREYEALQWQELKVMRLHKSTLLTCMEQSSLQGRHSS